jgi:hypothetical protein
VEDDQTKGMKSRNSLLIGQIALELGLLAPDQLQQCVDLQAGQVQPRPIGALLLENRFLTQAQLDEIILEQRRRLEQESPHTPSQKGSVAFGSLAVRHGCVKVEHLNEALRAQQDLADRGQRKRLGELLVGAGHLAAEVVPGLLKMQGKTLLACTFCGSHYNVLSSIAEGYPCRKCGMPLGEKIVTLSALETAYLLPAKDPRPQQTRESGSPPSPAPAASKAAASIPSLDAATRRALLLRLLQILTFIGILMLALWLFSKSSAG